MMTFGKIPIGPKETEIGNKSSTVGNSKNDKRINSYRYRYKLGVGPDHKTSEIARVE